MEIGQLFFELALTLFLSVNGGQLHQKPLAIFTIY